MAPVASTLPKFVHDAYDDVSKHPNNLLTMTKDALNRFRFVCPEFDTAGVVPAPNPKGTARGVWREATGAKLTIPLIGVIDADNSKIGAYGNLDKFNTPTLKKLKGCKFIVALTFPDFKEGHPDVAIADGVINQMTRLYDMQGIVNARVAEAVRYNNAARFVHDGIDFSGCIVTTLGVVFLPSVQETTAAEFLKRSPTKKQPAKDDVPAPPPNIVCDPNFWTQCVPGGKGLKHNDQLPITFVDGSRVGRTGDELTRELTAGRWVRVDCELVVWNMTEDTGAVRTFQLVVEKMLVLPRLPTTPVIGPGMAHAPLSAKAYTTCPPTGDEVAAGTLEKETADGSKKVGKVEDAKQDSDASTLSSGSIVPAKRAHAVDDANESKKVKSSK